MFVRRSTSIASAILVASLFLLAACASEPEPKPQEAVKQPTQKRAVKVEKPSAEQLANSPCGNPDWAQLPPGAEDKAPSDNGSPSQEGAPAQDSAPAQEGAPSQEEETEQTAPTNGEQSNNVEPFPTDHPCT